MSQHGARDIGNSLQRLRYLKAVSDGYGLDVVDTTFRVRNNLMTWNQGVATLDAARAKIDRSWKALAPMPRSPDQKKIFEQVLVARVRAHRAMDTLREILVARDLPALGHFADTELYPAIDPVTTRMEALSQMAMVNSERMVREWLASMGASGYLTYDSATQRYSLEPEKAMVFANEDSPVFLGGMYESLAAMFYAVPKIENARLSAFHLVGLMVAW